MYNQRFIDMLAEYVNNDAFCFSPNTEGNYPNIMHSFVMRLGDPYDDQMHLYAYYNINGKITSINGVEITNLDTTKLEQAFTDAYTSRMTISTKNLKLNGE